MYEKEFLPLAKLFAAHPAGAYLCLNLVHAMHFPLSLLISLSGTLSCALSLYTFFAVPRTRRMHTALDILGGCLLLLVNVSLVFISFAYGAENIFCACRRLIFMYSSSSLKRWKIKLYFIFHPRWCMSALGVRVCLLTH
jgi:hypothetical protein